MPTAVAPETRVYRKQLRSFERNLRNRILTSRFSTSTWNENELYRKKHNNI